MAQELFMGLDNNDSRIQYYHLLLERDFKNLPQYELPREYHFEYYQPGDKDCWITIEQSAKELHSYESGIETWEKYYGRHEHELTDRMVFIVNTNNDKIATATAYYDVTGKYNDMEGWLHWVAVKREYQGRGLSKPLIAHTLNRLRELNYTRAIVSTQTNTWLACKIYLDFGFLPTKQNAIESQTGWRIIKTLTKHPALDQFELAKEYEIWKSETSDT